MNRYDAAPPVDGPASISFREIVACDKGEHWPLMNTNTGREGGGVRVDRCKGSICDPNFSASSSSILMGRVSRCDNLSTRC